MEGKKQTRSTNAQIKKLTEYMSLNPAFANGEFTGPLGSRKMEAQWRDLKDILKDLGADKSIEQWKQTWRDLKRKARHANAKASAANASTVNPDQPVLVSSLMNNITLYTIGDDSSTGTGPNESGIGRRIPMAIPAAEARLCTSSSAVMQENIELLIDEDSEQSRSDHEVRPHFTNLRESTEDQQLESPISRESDTERPLSRESTSRKRKESNADPLSDSFPNFKRQRRVQSSTTKQMEEGFSYNKDRSDRSENEEAAAECDLYGQLLAQKLKPLDVDDRLVLMNDIDNLVFKYLMNIRKRSKLSRSTHLLSVNQTHSDNRQPIDLPGHSSRSSRNQDGSQKNIQNSQSMSINGVPFRILKTEASPP